MGLIEKDVYISKLYMKQLLEHDIRSITRNVYILDNCIRIKIMLAD